LDRWSVAFDELFASKDRDSFDEVPLETLPAKAGPTEAKTVPEAISCKESASALALASLRNILIGLIPVDSLIYQIV
jgi:hypothetical protein